jgi:predicted RNA-binding protein with PUA domain
MLKKQNRQRMFKTTKSKFWCDRCDVALIGELGKCSKCGYINKSKKKHSTPPFDGVEE